MALAAADWIKLGTTTYSKGVRWTGAARNPVRSSADIGPLLCRLAAGHRAIDYVFLRGRDISEPPGKYKTFFMIPVAALSSSSHQCFGPNRKSGDRKIRTRVQEGK